MLVLKRDLTLAGVHPKLVADVEEIHTEMLEGGDPMMVTDAGRTVKGQYALYLIGRDPHTHRPLGLHIPTVTKCDGRIKRSFHQARKDGFYHALDCAFMVDGPDADTKPDRPSWDAKHPWEKYGKIVEAHGLRWGGRWKRYDAPHMELK